MFTSKINGNSLFFPAAGYMTGGRTIHEKIDGGIWTSTNAFDQDDIVDYNKAYFLFFDLESKRVFIKEKAAYTRPFCF